MVCGELVRRAVEAVEGLGSVRLRREQVVEVEPELLCELPDVRVTLVDQLAAVLGDLPAGERPAIVQQRPPRRVDAS